jgi:hypothetical protein
MVRSPAGRFLAALFSAFVILVVLPGFALAGTQGSCPSGDTTKVKLWEEQHRRHFGRQRSVLEVFHRR